MKKARRCRPDPPTGMKSPPVIPSVTWAFGPPMDMKVTPACHSERSPAPYGAGRSEESAFSLLFVEASKSRFLVAPLFGMTGLGGADTMPVVCGAAHLVLLIRPVTLPLRV